MVLNNGQKGVFARGLGKSYIAEFSSQSAWNDAVEGRAKVYEKHPHVAAMVSMQCEEQWRWHPL